MKLQILNLIADKAKNCINCELHKNRINSVFHSGNPHSKLMFLGEAGGRDENASGVPFCGKSGKLLDIMIKSMGLERENVYVTNVCKCSPPDNRKPKPDEMSACRNYLDMQLEVIKPKIIVALGSTAVESLLGDGPGITKRCGNWDKIILFESNYLIHVMPCFHPSALLRNPNWKPQAAEALKSVVKKLSELGD